MPDNNLSFETLGAETSQSSADAASSTSATQATTTTETTETAATKAAQFTDSDAAETLQTLADLGLNKGNVHELISKGQTLEQMNYMLENNPQEFLLGLERRNPAIFQKVLDKATDIYLSRYHEEGSEEATSAQAGKSRTAVSQSIAPEVRALQDEMAQLRQEREQRQIQEQFNRVRDGYNTKVEEYLGKIDVPAKEKKAIRAMVNDAVGNDPATVARINKGIYIDIPKHFQKVMADWTADTTQASTSEQTKREQVKKDAAKEIAAGAQTSGAVSSQGSGDPWEDVETAVAADINKGRAAASHR